ncbi:MAG: phosphatase PAP2 family protein, partial [Candidatus Zixiibacteriota bacterium]
ISLQTTPVQGAALTATLSGPVSTTHSFIASADRDKRQLPSQNESFLKRHGWCIGLLGCGVLSFAVDRDLNVLSQKRYLHNGTADSFFEIVEPFGKGRLYFVSVPLFAGHGLLFNNKKSFTVSGELAIGYIFSQEVTRLLKAAFGRKRPYEADSPFKFFEGGSSFYSGHTVTIFTFATIISKNFPRQNLGFIGLHRDLPVIPVFSYSLAGLVGIQRLYSNQHWTSDVFFGALAGYVIGSAVVHFGGKICLSSFLIAPGESPIFLWSLHIG